MLADRFHLKAHMEDRELPIYNLVIGKDGSKIKPSADQTPTGPQATPTPYCGPVTGTPPPPAPPPLNCPFGPNANPRDPNFVIPRGMTMAMGGPNGSMIRGAAGSANVHDQYASIPDRTTGYRQNRSQRLVRFHVADRPAQRRAGQSLRSRSSAAAGCRRNCWSGRCWQPRQIRDRLSSPRSRTLD